MCFPAKCGPCVTSHQSDDDDDDENDDDDDDDDDLKTIYKH